MRIRTYASAVAGSLGCMALAACGTHSTVAPAEKASAKAEASALAALPAAHVLQTTAQNCATAHADVLHPFKMAEAVRKCLKAAYPGAHINALTTCVVKVYVADRGNAAKEDKGYNACAVAAKR